MLKPQGRVFARLSFLCISYWLMMEHGGDYLNQYNRFSPSYNLYSFHQPPPGLYAHGSFSQPSPQGASSATGGMECTDLAKVDSIGVKVINPGKKNEAKLFMLRNVNFHGMNSPMDLYAVIIEQLGRKTVADSTDFEVGYYVGNKRVWIRNQNDIHDVIHLLKITILSPCGAWVILLPQLSYLQAQSVPVTLLCSCLMTLMMKHQRKQQTAKSKSRKKKIETGRET